MRKRNNKKTVTVKFAKCVREVITEVVVKELAVACADVVVGHQLQLLRVA